MFFRSASRALAGVFLSVVVLQSGAGQEAKPKGLPPDTRRLLEEIAKVYSDCTAYSDKGVVEVDYAMVPSNGGKSTKTISATAQLAFARPNKLALTYGSLRLICDGNEMKTVIDGYKRYFVAKAPKEITLDTFSSERMRQLLLKDMDAMYLQFLLTLLLSRDPVSDIALQFESAGGAARDRLIDGKKCVCLNLSRADRKADRSLFVGEYLERRLLVDPDSKQLIGFEMDAKAPTFFFSAIPPPLAELPPGLEGVVVDTPLVGAILFPKGMRWVSGAITDRAPPDSAFTFTPPQDYQRVARFEDLFKPDPPPNVPRLKVEKPAVTAVRDREGHDIPAVLETASYTTN